jgi:ribonuclease HII
VNSPRLDMFQRQDFSTRGHVAGIDEAGRGPLAGPVVAAAVILHPDRRIAGLADSKTLTARRREQLADEIRARALCTAVAWADAAEIDAMNILAATMLAMRRAVFGLAITPWRLQVDGNRLPVIRLSGRRLGGDAVIRGDALLPAISAASILAKTARDRIMTMMDELYPGYEFARHKGYPTALHRERLRQLGPCEQHRRSFAPVRIAV